MKLLVFIAIALIRFSATPSTAQSTKTKLIILGVDHSAQLIAQSYRPAIHRAYLNRLQPQVICIERSPQEFARGDYYEFTYEQQYLVVPFARQHGLPICPIDWLPTAEDALLAFGLTDLEKPPFTRPAKGFLGFVSFSDSASLTRTLFFAETPQNAKEQAAFAHTLSNPVRYDFARRLYLYRTFMQAMRIQKVATQYSGKVILVVIGSLHKPDIEQILATDSSLDIIQPSAYGEPDETQIIHAAQLQDLFAVATFNLLGMQGRTKNVDWAWLKKVTDTLAAQNNTAETQLLKIRYQVLTERITAQQARQAYHRIAELPDAGSAFTWNGVKDASRLDSYFDPFGNLSVKQRALLEVARESYKLHQSDSSEQLKSQLSKELTSTKRQQLQLYWEEYLLK